MKCKIRPCTQDDLGTGWKYFSTISKSPDLHCVFCDSEVVAVTEYLCSPKGCQIGFTEVKQNYRGKGYGKYLVKKTMKKKQSPFTLAAEKDSVGFWKEMGFKKTGKSHGLTTMMKK